MSVIRFRCNNSGPAVNGSVGGLCLNGGTCMVLPVTGEELCECPKGFVHDFVFGHFKNCAMHEATWAVITGVTAALTVLSLAFTITALLDLRANVRRLLVTGAIAVVLNLCYMIAVWAQGGAYQAAQLLILLFNVFTYRTIMGSVRVFTAPAYAVLQRSMVKFNRAVNIMEAINFIAHVAAVIPMMIFSGEENPARYNMAAFMFLCFYALGLDCLGVLVVVQVGKLKQQIDMLSITNNALREAQQAALQKRLDKFYKGHCLLLVAFMINTVNPIVIIVMGSFPGQYILMAILNISVPGFVALFAYLYSQNKAPAPEVSSSAPAKAEDNVITVAPPSDSRRKRDTA